jgi:RNA polymerase sigma factor (sigma-70 family)
MAGTQAATILRHVRGLTAGLAGEVSDRELLERYTTAGEEAAFEALMRRHGPLVLGVCRRVLGNLHDAEDAFQAAFLTLARKAESIRQRESVGCWLYQVAFHMAVRARGQATARKRVERRAGAEPPADPLTELTGRELITVLDEELHGLPERYRVPLVLCYFQGLTCDEAARSAGWPVRTFKRRLEQARERLRGRLARRGLALPAALSAAGLAQGAEAAIPARLAGATVRAALRGAAEALPAGSAAPLAVDTSGALAALRFKPAAAALVLACLVTCGAVALAQQATPPPAGWPVEVRKQAAPLPTPQKKPGAAEAKRTGVTVSGRVLGSDGKPLAGAEVALVGRWYPSKQHPNHAYEVLAQVKTDAEGRFRLARNDLSPERFYHFHALAGAKGHGLGWQKFAHVGETKDVEMRLKEERVVRGRLFDLQGLPAEKVKGRLVFVAWKELLAELRDPQQRERLEMMRAELAVLRAMGAGVAPLRKPGGFEFELARAPEGFRFWPRAFTTDEKGGFEVRGLSPGQEAHVLIEDDRFARQELQVDTGGPKPPADMSLSLAPVQRIEGRVIYADTGKPAASAHIILSAFRTNVGKDTLAKTDAEGRFAVNPYPGTSFQLRVWAPEKEPYLNVEKRINWPKGAARQTVDIALPRGVEIKATVTETPAGKAGVKATIYYVPQRDNEVAKTNPLLVGSYWPAHVLDDGSYRIVVPPGPGHLLVDAADPNLITRTITREEVLSGKPGGPTRFHAEVVALNPRLTDSPKALEIKLRRGVTLRGKVLGPDGKPVREGSVICPGELLRPEPGQPQIVSYGGPGPLVLPVKDGRFELPGCDPEKTYRVFVLDVPASPGRLNDTPAGRRMVIGGDFRVSRARAAAMVELSAAKARDGELTIQLQPCGTARVRLRDAGGKPSSVLAWLELEVTPDRGAVQGERANLGHPNPASLGNTPLAPDKDGVVTLGGLVPGATYRFKAFDFRAQTVVELGRAFTVESGKTRKLPDAVAPQAPAAP